MPRSAKIAGVAALAGMMMAVAITAVMTGEPSAPAAATGAPALAPRDPLAHELDRCATLTMPDVGCEAAWDANRRRFFGEDGARP